MTYILKQIIIFILIVVIIGLIFISIKNKPSVIIEENINEPIVENNTPNILCYTDSMEQIDCEIVEEKIFAEKYIKDNIKTLATDEPVLGGSWYVTSVTINPIAHNGEVIYEDGHIESKANITYTYQKNPQIIAITKWEVNK